MVLSIKRIKKENLKKMENKLKKLQKISKEKIKLRSVLLPTVLNIFILNVLSNTIKRNCLNILILIHYILDVLCIIVMFVGSVEILCLSFNV